jgi:hypothetical protein
LKFGAESLDIDMNYFQGDAAAFRALFGIDPAGVVSEPGEPNPVQEYGRVAVKQLNLREKYGVGQRIAGQLFETTRVEVLERQMVGSDTWAHVRAEGWVAEHWYGQTLLKKD